MNKLHQALAAFLKNEADDTAVASVHNEHAPDSHIYTSIEDIADVFATDDLTAIARMVFFGDVESWYDRFFCLDGYANIYSFSSLTDGRSPVDFDWLAAQIIENEQYDEVDFDAEPYLSEDE